MQCLQLAIVFAKSDIVYTCRNTYRYATSIWQWLVNQNKMIPGKNLLFYQGFASFPLNQKSNFPSSAIKEKDTEQINSKLKTLCLVDSKYDERKS